MTETICITCSDEFDEFSGDVHKRVCMTCILWEEDPEAIQPSGVKVPDIHRRGFLKVEGRPERHTIKQTKEIKLPRMKERRKKD
jgi:hypothetical protein